MSSKWYSGLGLGCLLLLGAVADPGRASGATVSTPYVRAAAGMRTLAGWYGWGACRFYEPWVWFDLCHTGTFQPSAGWWNSANALTTAVDFTRLSGDPTYVRLIHHAFDSRDDHASISTNFVDDDGWWALAWVAAAELDASDHERSARELARAIYVFHDMEQYWDSRCGGGVWWQKSPRSYKNAIANELFLAVAAKLYEHTKDPVYLTTAREEYRWFFERSHLYAEGHLVVDGMEDGTCDSPVPTLNRGVWTYNQGVILGALTALRAAPAWTDSNASAARPRGPCLDHDVLRCGREIADVTLQKLTVNGILTEFETAEAHEELTKSNRRPQRESSEKQPTPTDCLGPDCPQFKGIFARNLGALARALPPAERAAYELFLVRNAESIWGSDRRETDGKAFFGVYWQGPFTDSNAISQSAALDALVEAIPLDAGGPPLGRAE